MDEIKQKLEIIREALNDYDAGKLSDLSALIVMQLTICKQKITEDDIKWAKKVLIDVFKIKC